MPKASGGQPYQSTGNTMLPVEPTLSDMGIERAVIDVLSKTERARFLRNTNAGGARWFHNCGTFTERSVIVTTQ